MLSNTLIEYALKTKKSEIVAKLEKAGYPKIDFEVECKKLAPKTAGLAYRGINKIELNNLYFADHADTLVNETLPHEICHLYQFAYHRNAKQAHGPEWKRLMLIIGLAPNTYHNMNIPEITANKRTKTRYIYTTQAGVTAKLTKQKHDKIQRGLLVVSLKGETMQYTGQIVKIK